MKKFKGNMNIYVRNMREIVNLLLLIIRLLQIWEVKFVVMEMKLKHKV